MTFGEPPPLRSREFRSPAATFLFLLWFEMPLFLTAVAFPAVQIPLFGLMLVVLVRTLRSKITVTPDAVLIRGLVGSATVRASELERISVGILPLSPRGIPVITLHRIATRRPIWLWNTLSSTTEGSQSVVHAFHVFATQNAIASDISVGRLTRG